MIKCLFLKGGYVATVSRSNARKVNLDSIKWLKRQADSDSPAIIKISDPKH